MKPQTELFLKQVETGNYETPEGIYPLRHILDHVKEWCYDGWGMPEHSPLTPPQIAAALLNEAADQDEFTSHYQQSLRWLAKRLLELEDHL